jgi:hypothetical protein
MGVCGFEGAESFACLLTCEQQTIRVMGSINGQTLKDFEILDRSHLLDFSLTSYHACIIISKSS